MHILSFTTEAALPNVQLGQVAACQNISSLWWQRFFYEKEDDFLTFHFSKHFFFTSPWS